MNKSIDWVYWRALSSCTIVEAAHLLANEDPDEHLESVEKSIAYKKMHRFVRRAIEDQLLVRKDGAFGTPVEESDRINLQELIELAIQKGCFLQTHSSTWLEDIRGLLIPSHRMP